MYTEQRFSLRFLVYQYSMKKPLNIGIIILIGWTVLLFFQSLQVYAIDYERVTVDELKSMLDNKADIVVVDVRSKESYDAGHISGAISMPYPDEIKAKHAELPQNKLTILYWSWLAEATSASSAQLLEDSFGFKHDQLKLLKGGFPLWQQTGYPIEKGAGTSVKSAGKKITLWGYIKRAGR